MKGRTIKELVCLTFCACKNYMAVKYKTRLCYKSPVVFMPSAVIPFFFAIKGSYHLYCAGQPVLARLTHCVFQYVVNCDAVLAGGR
jgi:hypothetical protein